MYENSEENSYWINRIFNSWLIICCEYIHPKSEVSGHPGSKSTFWNHAKMCLQAVLKDYYIMSFKRKPNGILKIGPDQKQISTMVLNSFFG